MYILLHKSYVTVHIHMKDSSIQNHDYNIISPESGQDTSACKLSGHSFNVLSRNCPETYPDGRMDGRPDRQTDGWTDGKPENIMPLKPKGGGITEV